MHILHAKSMQKLTIFLRENLKIAVRVIVFKNGASTVLIFIYEKGIHIENLTSNPSYIYLWLQVKQARTANNFDQKSTLC